jgi:hypothetical protein
MTGEEKASAEVQSKSRETMQVSVTAAPQKVSETLLGKKYHS